MIAPGACIALIEDDDLDATLYAAWLGHAGWQVNRFNSGADFRRKLGATSVDAIVLDWMLPDENGLQILDWLKSSAHSAIPVIFLTSNGNEADVVRALRAGAEDYVAKPPRRGELVARMHVLLRRCGIAGRRSSILDVPPFQLDLSERKAYFNGALQKLTEREFDLLAFLFRRTGRIVSREMLLSQVWRVDESQVKTKTIDTHASRLRKKLGLDGASGWRLTAIYQHGYRLENLKSARTESLAIPSA